MRPIKTHRHHKALLAAVGLVAGMVPAVLLATAPAAGAAASTGNGISYTLEGCRNNGGIVLPIGGKYICDTSAYTTGNLGKGWNELDLVPARLTLQAGNKDPGSYQFVLAVDNKNAGISGYDVLSSDSGGTPVLNSSLSHGTCGTLTASGEQYATPGIGGTDTTLYRTLSVSGQAANSTCVYDAYARLALGSHAYPGSSLHFDLANTDLGTAGIGAKDVSIPVKEIAPQQLSKTMGANKDTAFVWTLKKEASPVEINFSNTCEEAAPLTASVAVTLSWTKSAGNTSGYTVTTVVTATNPASRVITVDATDEIYSGGSTDATTGVHTGGTLLGTLDGGPIDVSANSSLVAVSQTLNVNPSDLPDPGSPDFNDVATATYIDKATNVEVPGMTFAYASVANGDIGTGLISGDSIDLVDSESMTGAGLDFKVATPSVGSFDGYTAGDWTTGPVVWKLDGRTSSGSVTFDKTVRTTAATITSGTLSDTATGTFSDGAPATATASTSINSGALVSLEIDKTRTPVTSEAQTFSYVVKDSGNNTVATPSITVPGGTATTTPTPTTVSGLAPGTYTVNEPATGPYPAQQASATIALPSCSGAVSFENVAAPAGARVQKITVPTSSTTWDFTLSGPDVGVSGTETVTATAGAGYVDFASALDTDGATYTITEMPKAGYDLSAVSGDFGGASNRVTTSMASRTCSFVLDMPADSGGALSCTFTNTERGHVGVVKTENGAAPIHAYTFELTGGPDSVDITRTTDANNGGTLDFGSLKPGTYTLCELAVPAGTHSGLQDLPGATVDPNTGNVCYTFTLDPGGERVFVIDNSYPQGGQRTIGYWKNWNTCNGHGGDWEAKSAKTGNHLLDEFLSQTLGNYIVDTCQKAVAVLSSPSTKYAESGLAAQLLAAKLNLAAGAASCGISSTVAAADALLVSIGYAGPPSAILGSSKSQAANRALATSLAATLDDYNNGLLC